MTMGNMLVDKYAVQVVTKIETFGGYKRALFLSGKGPFTKIQIQFNETDVQGDLGFENEGFSQVVVNTRLRDFDHMYHVLQTEKPVTASWQTLTGTTKLARFALNVGDEPLGEGPQDLSV
jgi:hypothetical protein